MWPAVPMTTLFMRVRGDTSSLPARAHRLARGTLPFPRPLLDGALRLQPHLAPLRPAPALVLTQRIEHLHEAEVNLPALHVDPHHLDSHAIAQPVRLVSVLSAQRVRRFEEAVVIVGHARDVHEPLDEVLGQLDEQPERGYAGDVPVELVADLVGHEPYFLPLHQ